MACSTLMVPILVPAALVVAGAGLGAAGLGAAAAALLVWAKAAMERANAVVIEIRTNLLVMRLLWTPWTVLLGLGSDRLNRSHCAAPKSSRPRFQATGRALPSASHARLPTNLSGCGSDHYRNRRVQRQTATRGG